MSDLLNEIRELSKVLHQEVALTVVCLFLSTVAVCLRLWTKVVILRKVQTDDWFLIAALIAYYVLLGFQCYLTFMIDRFVDRAIFPSLSTMTVILKTAVIMYPLVMALVKLALSCILSRVFLAVSSIRYTVWIIAGFTVVSSLVTSIFVAVSCGTIASLLPLAPNCGLLTAYNIIGTFFAAANCFTDLVLVCLSVTALWNVRMTRWKKVSTITLLSLGMTTWAVSLARLIWTYSLPQEEWTPIHNTKSVFFSIVECFCAITGTSLSGIRPLARVWQAKIKDSLKGSDPSHLNASGSNRRAASGSSRPGVPKISHGDESLLRPRSRDGFEMVDIDATEEGRKRGHAALV